MDLIEIRFSLRNGIFCSSASMLSFPLSYSHWLSIWRRMLCLDSVRWLLHVDLTKTVCYYKILIGLLTTLSKYHIVSKLTNISKYLNEATAGGTLWERYRPVTKDNPTVLTKDFVRNTTVHIPLYYQYLHVGFLVGSFKSYLILDFQRLVHVC